MNKSKSVGKKKPAAKTKNPDVEQAESKATQAQIGLHNMLGAIRTAENPPMTIEQYQLWAGPVMDAINAQAEMERMGE